MRTVGTGWSGFGCTRTIRPVVRSPTSAVLSGIIVSPTGARRCVATTSGSPVPVRPGDGDWPGAVLPGCWPAPGELGDSDGTGMIGVSCTPGPSPFVPKPGLGSQVGSDDFACAQPVSSSPAAPTSSQDRARRMTTSLPGDPVGPCTCPVRGGCPDDHPNRDRIVAARRLPSTRPVRHDHRTWEGTMSGEGLDNGAELSRRSLLRLVGGGLLVSAGLGALDSAVGPPAQAAPVTRTAPPAWQRRWHHPIESLVRFEHRMPHLHRPRKAIMLTIDDGPHAEWTPKYLRLLAKYDVHATFCMIGRQIHPLRHIVHDVAARGHAIANHTWNHDEALTYGSAAHIRSEIHRTSVAIHRAAGVWPTQFRAPGGVWGPPLFDELVRQRLMPLGWDIDPADWSRPGTAAIESAMLRARTHDIILCHDGGGDRSETYRALKRVIPTLLHRGHTFVTLPKLTA